MNRNSLLFSIGFACSVGCISCEDNDSNGNQGLIATDAQLVNLGSNYSFTEGPAVDKNGNVFFTDQPNDIIYKWDAVTGDITPFLEETGRSNGMAFDKDGNLRSEEHTSELQSPCNLVCRLLLEKKKKTSYQ